MPQILWVAGSLDLTAYRYREVPEPVRLDDGEMIGGDFDPSEISSVHLMGWSGDASAAGAAPAETRATRTAPAGTWSAATAPPRRLDRLATARWRQRLVELPAGPGLAAHLAERPQAPEHLDLTPTAGGSEQEAWAQALLDSVVARQRLIDHLQARQAADLAELEGNYPGLVEFLPTELAIALHVTENAAGRQIDTARRLRLRLPAAWSAWDTGQLSSEKARYLGEATKDLDQGHTGRVERSVLPAAPGQTLPEFRAAVRRAIIRTDPDGAQVRHEKARANRRIEKYTRDDGMGELRYHATAAEVQQVWEALTGIARAAKTPDDERTLDQRRADALTDLCIAVLDDGGWAGTPLPKRQRSKTLINVTIPITALAGGSDVCDLEGYGPITAGQAWTLVNDAELRRMVCDPVTGELLEVSVPEYRPPKWLADQVIARDQTCVAPGCRTRATHSQLDHRKPYAQGGATSRDNLNSLCLHHHRGKDGGGLQLKKLADGSYHWTTPLGRTARRRPAQWWRPPDPNQTALYLRDVRASGTAADDPPPF